MMKCPLCSDNKDYADCEDHEIMDLVNELDRLKNERLQDMCENCGKYATRLEVERLKAELYLARDNALAVSNNIREYMCSAPKHRTNVLKLLQEIISSSYPVSKEGK
jgi:hypothetical protein